MTVTLEQLVEVRGREISWPDYSQHRLGLDHDEAVRRATRNLRNEVEVLFREIPPGFEPVFHRDFTAIGAAHKPGAPVMVVHRKASVLGGHVEYQEDFDADVAAQLGELMKDYTAIRALFNDVLELGVRKAVERATVHQAMAERPRA